MIVVNLREMLFNAFEWAAFGRRGASRPFNNTFNDH